MISNDFMHMFAKHFVQFQIGLGGRYDVGVVLILNLPMNAPYILEHQVVDRGCDIPVESYVVHSPNIGQVEPGYKERIALFLIFLSNVPIDTVFGTCQNDQSGLIGRRKVIVLRW
jgi:hypothetical protein